MSVQYMLLATRLGLLNISILLIQTTMLEGEKQKKHLVTVIVMCLHWFGVCGAGIIYALTTKSGKYVCHVFIELKPSPHAGFRIGAGEAREFKAHARTY